MTVRISLAFILFTGCISLAPRSQVETSAARSIDEIPARRWADNSCAAGALSEVLNSLGDPITEEQLSPSLLKARKGGVVTVDLLIAARNRGFDAQLLRGDLQLVQQELEQKHALILMLRVMDAPGKTDDLFHYVVLSGIDPERGLVRMHYGDGRMRWVTLPPLEPAWRAAGHATFLIGPRTKQPATDEDLKRAVVLEEAGKTSQAISLYKRYLDSHPESALAWTNLGNAQSNAGEKQLAEVAFRNALFVEKDHRDALNNLAWLLFEQKRFDEAETLARRAAALDGSDRYLALDTLAQILAARGRCEEARSVFAEALRIAPQDAKLTPLHSCHSERSERSEESPAFPRTNFRGDAGDSLASLGTGSSLRFAALRMTTPLFTRSPAQDVVPAPPSASNHRDYWITYAWLTASTIYDVESTFHYLDRCPHCQETNPLIKPFIERGRLPTYLFAAALNAGIMYIADRMLDRADPMWRYLPITVTIVHAIAGTWNIYQSINDVGPP